MIYPNARYEIFVCDNLGNIIAPFNMIDFNLFVELDIVRTVNQVGACYIRLSGGSNSVAVLSYMTRYNILKKDTIFVIYRTIGNVRSLLLDTVWFVRTIEQFRQGTGSFVIKITAKDANYLLSSRILQNVSQGDRESTIANLMSTFVQYNIGSGAGTRQMTNFTESSGLGKYGYSIGYYLDDPTQISTFSLGYEQYNLLEALQQLSKLTLSPINVNDVIYPVYFDTVATAPNAFVFQLFPGQRGSDRRYTKNSAKGLILSDTLEQMRDIRLTADWSEEITAISSVYKINEQKIFVNETDIRRVANSPYSVREKYFGTSAPDENTTRALVRAELRDEGNYPTYSVYAYLQDIPSFLFGIDWNYGDYVTINAFGTQVDARINAINIMLTNKSEQIEVKFDISESISF